MLYMIHRHAKPFIYVSFIVLFSAMGCDDGNSDASGNDGGIPDAFLNREFCTTDSCSRHGTCDDMLGFIRCFCDTGYVGDYCGRCAEGYQDNDDNGSCKPDCANSGLDCWENGHCEDDTGTAVCICNYGYTGYACGDCAEGFQDNDNDGDCVHTCATSGKECTGNSVCDDSSGAAVCVCIEGYTGDDCSNCAEGYQDNDYNGTCLVSCSVSGLQCGDDSGCDDSGGTAVCVCHEGFQDNDSNGSCLPSCSGLGNPCSTDGHCDDSSGTVACICDNGYQDNDSDMECMPDCATAAFECSGIGLCEDSSGTAVCICPEHFLHDGLGNCLTGHSCDNFISILIDKGPVSGNTSGLGNNHTGSCGGNSEDIVYEFGIDEPLNLSFRTTGYDTLIYLRSACDDEESEIDCNDDFDGLGSRIETELDAGTYYLFVDGYSTGVGAFSLNIDIGCLGGKVYDPDGGLCVDDPCDPNPCEEENRTICEPILPDQYECYCDPGYMTDPGPTDDCIPVPGESCLSPVSIEPVQGSENGSTVDSLNDSAGSCGGSGADHVYVFTIAEPLMTQFEMTGYDTVLHVRTDCDDVQTETACNDDSEGQSAGIMQVLDAGTYYVWADSYSSGGSYSLQYDFRNNPCDSDPCPGEPDCVPDEDWNGYECECPEGTIMYGEQCVTDPCDPNPCSEENKNVCEPVLPDNHECYCNPGYVDDGFGNCIKDPDVNEWTVAVFLNADNNLESYGWTDIDEMETAGSTPYVNIVTLFDRYTGPGEILYIKPGEYEVIEDWGETDMADWTTLRDFGIWMVDNYPARHYAFIIWNHGSGWRAPEIHPLMKGFSNDSHGSTGEIRISNGEYASAMQGIVDHLGRKLDIIGFDACLMGMWEVAEASAPFADYFIGSSENIPVDGWAYHGFLPELIIDHTMTAENLSVEIIDSYYNESTNDSTLSVTDLSTIDDLETAMSAFADELMAYSDHYAKVETIRDATQKFSHYDSYRDIQDFAQRIADTSDISQGLEDAANALVSQLAESIVYNRAHSSHPGANGLSIYLPSYGSSVDSMYTGSGAVWSQATTWDEFLYDFTE